MTLVFPCFCFMEDQCEFKLFLGMSYRHAVKCLAALVVKGLRYVDVVKGLFAGRILETYTYVCHSLCISMTATIRRQPADATINGF